MIETSQNWTVPTGKPVLAESCVDVWRVFIPGMTSFIPAGRRDISEEERTRAERFVRSKDRDAFIVSHGVLRHVLAIYTGIPAPEQVISKSERGKPRLELPNGAPPLEFNLTHSHDWALVAVSRKHAVGVDVEFIRNGVDAQAIANRFFSRREKQAVLQAASDQRRKLFFDIWVRKEAYLKALGTGLATGLSRFCVPLESCTPVLFAPNHPEASATRQVKWVLHTMNVGQEYTSAVVTTARVAEIRMLQWTIDCIRMAPGSFAKACG